MKVNPAIILLVLLILGMVAFFVVTRSGSGQGQSNNSISTHVSRDTNKQASQVVKTKRTFDYSPEKPINGTLKGVVEIGATGFNSFVINVDSAQRWEIISKDFGSSLVYEGLATTNALQAGINDYLSRMFDQAVDKQNIYFVVSSGAQKEAKTAPIADALIAKGFNVNLVTPELEAMFGFLATVPKSFRENSFYVDIGSGNSQIAWQVNGKIFSSETYGSKYFEKRISDTAVYQEVFQKAKNIPEKNRAFCFIVGGAPFKLAEQVRSNEERYTLLSEPNSYTPTDKRIGAGTNIYRSIYDATKCRFFVFDWDTNFTIGYLLGTK